MEAENVEPALSEQATEELLKLLVERGCFHSDVDPVAEEQYDDSLEGMLRAKEKERVVYSELDRACQLVSTRDGRYLTKLRLQNDLLQEVQSCGGRLSFSDASISLGVDGMKIECAAQALSASVSELELVGTELIASKYLDEVAVRVETQLAMQGQVRVSDLAEKYCIPSEMMFRVLSERLDGKLIRGTLLTVGGVRELVSPEFERLQRRRVAEAFSSLTMPASFESVCHEFEWEASTALPIVRDLCTKGEVPGELHESGTSLTGAMYVPCIYLELQRKSVDEFFATNGYIDMKKCVSMGIVASKMGAYIKTSFPSAVVLPTSVINEDVVASPLEEVIREAIATSTFVDLKMHLPEDYSNGEDVIEIFNNLIVPKLAQSKGKSRKAPGICVTGDGEALFFSSGMIESITKKVIPQLVEAYGKSRAGEIDRSMTEAPSSPSAKIRTSSIGSEEEDHKSRGRAKGRRKGKKASKKETELVTNQEFGVVPLALVASEVATRYPDLADIQDNYGPMAEVDKIGAPVWETSEDEEGNSASRDGPIYEFCRAALYTRKLREQSARAVQAELDKIQSVKQAISVSSRKDGAARVRTIEHAFEDKGCFPAACYLVQMHAKFIEFASASDVVDEETLSVLKADFLRGCCADFSRRITEYCLFKNEIEEGMFLFAGDTDLKQTEAGSLPQFCQPVKAAVRFFPEVSLFCSPGDDGKARLPLPVIRKLFAGNVGNVGVALARMWSLCGGACYDGGKGTTEDGAYYTRPGDYDGFLKHVEDSCLTICGLPFKKLDKKSEKQVMFSRRQELTQALKDATEAELVLDLTVMLLFQQVKGIAVSGSLLSGPILAMLAREKKVPEHIATLLKKLADSIQSAEEIDEGLIESVRACGLSRDISKHQVD